jgi:hypothetical protein
MRSGPTRSIRLRSCGSCSQAALRGGQRSQGAFGADCLSLQPPFIAMPVVLSRLWFSLRFALLAASVLLVLGLHQRAVSVLRLPAYPQQTRLAAPPKATRVKQKVLFEATALKAHFVAPAADAWLPLPVFATTWRAGLRRALATPPRAAGPGAGEIFRVRLLAVALSPQAP